MKQVCRKGEPVSDMKLYEAMSTMRAVRKLRPDPIPEDVLQRVFEAATWAPTGGNRQPWRMIAVTDTPAKTRLGALYKARWNDYAAMHRKGSSGLSDEARAAEERTLAAGDHLADHMKDLPVLVIVCFNPKYLAVTDAGLDRVSVVGGGSIYPACRPRRGPWLCPDHAAVHGRDRGEGAAGYP